MTSIAFLGMGSMGSRMALKLLEAGYSVRVWNRSADRVRALDGSGAETAESPRAAAVDADFVIAMLRDDQASRYAWCDSEQGALGAMKAGAMAIDCSTLSVQWVGELHRICSAQNIAFVDAPVAGTLPQAESAQLIFFVGGDSAHFEAAGPLLRSMASAVHHAGGGGAGASLKLAVNAMFGSQLVMLAELIGVYRASGLDPQSAIRILAATPVCSPAAALAAEAMLNANFKPMFPIDLVEKDFAYAAAFAEDHGLSLPLIDACRQCFRQAQARGFGEDNITGIVQLYD